MKMKYYNHSQLKSSTIKYIYMLVVVVCYVLHFILIANCLTYNHKSMRNLRIWFFTHVPNYNSSLLDVSRFIIFINHFYDIYICLQCEFSQEKKMYKRTKVVLKCFLPPCSHLFLLIAKSGFHIVSF